MVTKLQIQFNGQSSTVLVGGRLSLSSSASRKKKKPEDEAVIYITK